MLKVNLIGIGPGNPELLTQAAAKAIQASTVLIGDSRMIKQFANPDKKLYPTIKTQEIADIIEKLDPKEDVVGILVSGDLGFFSLAKTIAGKLHDCEISRYCGISSLVYFAQSIGLSWDDAKIISMHGRNNNLIAAVSGNSKVFALTGGDNNVATLCQTLVQHQLGQVQIYVGENLSYPNEKITLGTAVELAEKEFPSLAVMMIINKEAKISRTSIHGLPDECFTRTKVPMTKQEVRSICISKLAPQSTDIIFDVGAGTGSCSIELAQQVPQGRVYAFEKNQEAVELIGLNKKRFGIDNLTIIAGDAAEEIKQAPVPDKVFIGGSGGNLNSILDYLYSFNPGLKVVITAITIETIAEIADYYKDKKQYATEMVNVAIARSKVVGSYHLMMAQNPIYVVTATMKEA